MTAPLVPAEVDLREFSYMPLHVLRLRDSDLAALASAEEFRCAVLLWCASWHQLPAASLPDDDAVLANLAGLGRDVRKWRKLKAVAMRGFVKCDDGRLYHPLLAEKAIEVWDRRRSASGKGKAGASARWRGRHASGVPPANGSGNAPAIAQALPEQSVSNGNSNAHAMPTHNSGNAQAMPNDGYRKGKGKGKITSSASLESETRAAPMAQALPEHGPSILTNDLTSAAKQRIVKAYEEANSPNLPDTSHVDLWVALGYDLDVCVAVVADGIKRKPSIASLRYFDAAIREQHEKRLANGHSRPADHETADEREARLRRMWDAYQRGIWLYHWGTEPLTPGSEITKELVEKWSQPQSTT